MVPKPSKFARILRCALFDFADYTDLSFGFGGDFVNFAKIFWLKSKKNFILLATI